VERLLCFSVIGRCLFRLDRFERLKRFALSRRRFPSLKGLVSGHFQPLQKKAEAATSASSVSFRELTNQLDKRLMLGPGFAFTEKVSYLDSRGCSAGRLIGFMQDGDAPVVVAT
jgi:hypothetical protein